MPKNYNQEYYDLINLNSTLNRELISNGFMTHCIHYLKDIVSVKVSMFRYKNIERIPNLTSEILETALLFRNFLCFYDHPQMGFILCVYRIAGTLNEYLRPTFVDLLDLHGQTISTNVDYKDIILCRDNSLDIIPFLTLMEYIKKIDACDTAVFKALNVATLPLVLVGNKKLANQLNITAKKLTQQDAFIAGDDMLPDSIKAFDIDVKVNPLDIYELKTKYKNECASSIGIYTVEQKKERKIVNEVASQNEYTDMIYEDMREQRIKMVDLINSIRPDIELELIEEKRVIAQRNIDDQVEILSAQARVNMGGNKDDSENK